ncbi:hypothetical protein V6N12_009577 [Hibiscus sabdariffa]|uniref:Uncharacterized protein n=1 Tax=Hibiscus sabdariffa TaxID=183260 RepID=A0ABR2B2B0_9ROSI
MISRTFKHISGDGRIRISQQQQQQQPKPSTEIGSNHDVLLDLKLSNHAGDGNTGDTKARRESKIELDLFAQRNPTSSMIIVIIMVMIRKARVSLATSAREFSPTSQALGGHKTLTTQERALAKRRHQGLIERARSQFQPPRLCLPPVLNIFFQPFSWIFQQITPRGSVQLHGSQPLINFPQPSLSFNNGELVGMAGPSSSANRCFSENPQANPVINRVAAAAAAAAASASTSLGTEINTRWFRNRLSLKL